MYKIDPKFDHQFCVDLSVLYKLRTENSFCFVEMAEQFKVPNFYKTHNT